MGRTTPAVAAVLLAQLTQLSPARGVLLLGADGGLARAPPPSPPSPSADPPGALERAANGSAAPSAFAPGRPSPPLLQLSPNAVDVAWFKPPVHPEAVGSYELLIALTRPKEDASSSSHTEHLELRAGAETEYEWTPVPAHARACFRVRAVGRDGARSEYSGETCFSNCACARTAAPPVSPTGLRPVPKPPPLPAPPSPAPAAPRAAPPPPSGAAAPPGGIEPAAAAAAAAGMHAGGGAHAHAPDPPPCDCSATFLAGLVVGAGLATGVGAAAFMLSRGEARLQMRALKGAGSLGTFRGKGAADEATASEYAHLNAPEPGGGGGGGGGGSGCGGAHEGAGRGGGAEGEETHAYGGCALGVGRALKGGAGGGIALAELELASASAQVGRQTPGPPPPPMPLHGGGGGGGGGYPHAPPGAGAAGYAHGCAGGAHPPPPIHTPSDGAHAGGGALPPLEGGAAIEPGAFEEQWTLSARSSATLCASAPAAPMPAAEEIEAALAQLGLVCIAAGAVSAAEHKAYYAAQLSGGPGYRLLMLELVMAPARQPHAPGGAAEGVSATATFRCPAHECVPPFADSAGIALGRVLGAAFSPVHAAAAPPPHNEQQHAY